MIDIEERIQNCTLLQLMDRYPKISTNLGLVDVSKYNDNQILKNKGGDYERTR